METVEQTQTRISDLTTFSARQFVLRYGVYVSLAVLLLAALLFVPAIYSTQSLFLVLRLASQLGLVAIGQTLVLLLTLLVTPVTYTLFDDLREKRVAWQALRWFRSKTPEPVTPL